MIEPGIAKRFNFTRAALTIAALAILSTVAAADPPDVSPAEGWDNLPPAEGNANDWPWWRGPSLDNCAPASQKPPLTWSETENVLWRVELPGQGHATPCISGKRIFLPAGAAAAQTIQMLCLDRATGKELWRTVVFDGPFPKIHKDNSHASATPACDGERVFFPYQTETTIRLAALDIQGKIIWDEEVGPYKSIQGYSASPALHKSTVIVAADGSLGNYIAALHRKTGKIVWRAPLKKTLESYASPLVARVAGRDQLLIIGGVDTQSYDPNNGQPLWKVPGPAEFCAATVAFDKDTVYSTGGYPEKALLAIRADSSLDGKAADSRLRWKSDRKVGYVPSPLFADGLLYAVSDTGLMRCYDTTDGRIVWEKNLQAPFYSSPVLVGERVYLSDRKGKTFVMKVGRQYESLAVNNLPDGAFATPVFLDNRVYLRTLKDFYCLGAD